jgi:signal transduction histidine kinase
VRNRLRPDRVSLASGAAVAALGALVLFDSAGVLDVSLLVMAAILAAFGVALLGRGRSRAAAPGASSPERLQVLVEPPPGARRSRFADLYNGVFGVLLVIGAALLFLSSNNVLSGVRDAALTAVVVVVAIGLILAPFLWRLGRSLAAERAERIRSQERSELAAHLHDSVLQTLTLMQKRADDPREVAALARRQERELRDWLAADGPGAGITSFASALRSAAEAIEDDHRVAIEVVTVGDGELDARADAVLGAAREAFTNAAKHAAEPGPIRVYAEVKPGSIEVFVRDRGSGFDLAAVPAHRRGVRESIVGRMERAGGRAEVRAIPGGGTEVALRIARTATTREDGPR